MTKLVYQSVYNISLFHSIIGNNGCFIVDHLNVALRNRLIAKHIFNFTYSSSIQFIDINLYRFLLFPLQNVGSSLSYRLPRLSYLIWWVFIILI